MNSLHPTARPMLKVASNAFSEAQEVEEGTIVKLTPDRGFGFIRTNHKGDLFFDRSVLEGVDFDALGEGQTMEVEARWDGYRHCFSAALVRPPSPPGEPGSARAASS